MEWTESARRELSQLLEKVRASLNPAEVDPNEVVSDIRERIESELSLHNGHTVTAENVRSAAGRIGIQDLVCDGPPVDRRRDDFEQRLKRPHRVRSSIARGWF